MLEAQALALLIPAAPGQDMDAATHVLIRRRLDPSRASTLRKAHRVQRIANRRRPERLSATRERVIGLIAGADREEVVEEVLHPTKGWRPGRRYARRAP